MSVPLSGKAEGAYRVQTYGGDPPVDGVAVIPLRRFHDDGGALTELLRPESMPAELRGFRLRQINYSVLEPGVVKAFHVHLRQTDVWFVPPEDRVLLVAHDVRKGSSTEGGTLRTMLGNGESRLVRIPPGVAHGCRNLGAAPARLIYLTDLEFDPAPERCDEGRLPWDFLGTDVWDVCRE